MSFKHLFCVAALLGAAPHAYAQSDDQFAAIAKNATVIDAKCTKSVVSFGKVMRLRCTMSPLFFVWPDGWSSLIFTAEDRQEEQTQFTFSSGQIERLAPRHYIMNLANVQFGKLRKEDKWHLLPVNGTCEIFLHDEDAKMVDGIVCEARARIGVGSFVFVTGPGAAQKIERNAPTSGSPQAPKSVEPEG